MARTHNVNVEIRAEIADFTKKVTEASNLTDKQAKKMANSFSKQMSRMEKAAKADLNPKGLKDFEEAAGDVDSVVAALAGGLSEISPELGSLVALGAESASVFEAVAKSGSKFARVLGPLVIVVGIAAAAYEHFKEKAEESEEALEAQAKAAETAERAFSQMADTIEDVQHQNLLLSGLMDDLEVKQLQQEKRIRQGFESEIQMREELIASIKAQEAAIIARLKSGKEEGPAIMRLDAELSALKKTRYEEVFALKQVNAQLDTTISMNAENNEMIRATREEKEAAKEASERKRKADKRAAEAAREQAAADRDAANATRERSQAMAEADAAADKLIKTERELMLLTEDLFNSAESLADKNPMEALEEQQLDFLKRFEEKSLRALTLAEQTGGDIAALDESLNAERLDIEASFLEQKAKLQAEAAEKEKKEALDKIKFMANLSIEFINEVSTFELEKRTQTIKALQGIEATMGEQMNEAQRALLNTRIEMQKKAALRAFKAQQAGAVAQITIDTAAAIMKTMSQFGFPWGLIPAGMMGVMGGIEIAKVMRQAPPSFHTGGMVADVTNDEANIRVLRSEAILNPTAVSAIGREGVNSLNQGQGMAPQMVVVQYRNRVLDVTLQDVSRRPGPLRSALAQRNRLGHSNRRR